MSFLSSVFLQAFYPSDCCGLLLYTGRMGRRAPPTTQGTTRSPSVRALRESRQPEAVHCPLCHPQGPSMVTALQAQGGERWWEEVPGCLTRHSCLRKSVPWVFGFLGQLPASSIPVNSRWGACSPQGGSPDPRAEDQTQTVSAQTPVPTFHVLTEVVAHIVSCDFTCLLPSLCQGCGPCISAVGIFPGRVLSVAQRALWKADRLEGGREGGRGG